MLQLADECLNQHESSLDRVEMLERLLGVELCRRLGVYRLPPGFRLTVIIPSFNEAATIETIIQRVRDTDINCELIVVNDGSTDNSTQVLTELQDKFDLIVLHHEKNRGKGAAIRTALPHASGDVVTIQHADLEYNPSDLRFLIQPIIEQRADVVYGSRFSSSQRAVSSYWHQMGNMLITFFSNLRTGLNLSDVETCYKVFPRELIQSLTDQLRENGFGIELEITAKLARRQGVRFCERPIQYVSRSYAEGKKIGWRDAVRALFCIVRY